MKRLKNIEGKNDEQLKAIKDQGEKQLDEIKNNKTNLKSSRMVSFFSWLSPEAKELLDELKEETNNTNFIKLVCESSLDFASDIYNGKISLEEAKKFQCKMVKLLDDLKE